jgi:hypothetical protein
MTYMTYDARGIREDLADVIYNISPIDTPFVSNVGKTTAEQTYFEWQTDALASASANNAVVEGADAGSDNSIPTSRMGNYTQISSKVVQISGTLEAVRKAGRKSELAYQLAKRGNELKRDMEASLTSYNVAVPGNDTTARVTAGFGSFIITNSIRGAGGADPVYSGGTSSDGLPVGYPTTAPTAGTAAAITEANFKTMLQLQWTAGGKADFVLVDAGTKQAISLFTGIATRFRDVPAGEQAQIIGAADVYVSDFGDVTIVPDRFTKTGVAYGIDLEYAAVAYLRNFQVLQLAKTGDSEKRQLIVEYGLKVMNPLAHSVYADLNT